MKFSLKINEYPRTSVKISKIFAENGQKLEEKKFGVRSHGKSKTFMKMSPIFAPSEQKWIFSFLNVLCKDKQAYRIGALHIEYKIGMIAEDVFLS